MKESVEINVPTSWGDVSLKVYQDYTSKIAGLTDEDEIVIQSISSLCGIPLKLIKMLKREDIKRIYITLSKLISLPINKEVIDKIEINGITYGFHSNLDEMTLGEFVDLDEYSKEGVGGIQYILSILYRPITETKGNKYNIEAYNESHIQNARHFQDLSIDVVNGVMVFFYHLGSELLMNSQSYLERVEEKLMQGQVMVGSA
tara:strand:+ start:12305 stop:12910 length:606 start_codon:yes stop_codon:yes gene_type:complete